MSNAIMLDVFGVAVVGINVAVWLVARRLVRVNPRYLRTRDGQLRWWLTGSTVQALRMIFDPTLPDPAHGVRMRSLTYMVRILYALVMIGGAFLLFSLNKHAGLSIQ